MYKRETDEWINRQTDGQTTIDQNRVMFVKMTQFDNNAFICLAMEMKVRQVREASPPLWTSVALFRPPVREDRGGSRGWMLHCVSA